MVWINGNLVTLLGIFKFSFVIKFDIWELRRIISAKKVIIRILGKSVFYDKK